MHELEQLGVLDIKNGSAELFFDDEGVLQQIIYRKNHRRREGEPFEIRALSMGKITANYGPNDTLAQVIYETTWKRKLAKP